MEQTISVKALKRFITESSNEFKAVLGPNVETDDKSINGKAYDETKKRTEKYNGGIGETGGKRVKYVKNDTNKTTLDYTPDNVSDDYKERVKAQVKGYTSVSEMENNIEKAADFSDNENIYDGIKKSGQEMHNNEVIMKKSGLQGREWPEKIYKKGEMYESKEGFDMRQMIDRLSSFDNEYNQHGLTENKKIKTIYYKKTEFLTEGHMLSRIPDDFKFEGNQFKMKDKTGNEYLIEWKNNKGNIIGHNNTKGFDDFLTRINELNGYSSQYTETNRQLRINENEDKVKATLDLMRNLKNKK